MLLQLYFGTLIMSHRFRTHETSRISFTHCQYFRFIHHTLSKTELQLKHPARLIVKDTLIRVVNPTQDAKSKKSKSKRPNDTNDHEGHASDSASSSGSETAREEMGRGMRWILSWIFPIIRCVSHQQFCHIFSDLEDSKSETNTDDGDENLSESHSSDDSSVWLLIFDAIQNLVYLCRHVL